MILCTDRLGNTWFVWHDNYLAEPQRVSPLMLILRDATEAEVLAIAEMKLAEPLPEPEPEPWTLELTGDELVALQAQL